MSSDLSAAQGGNLWGSLSAALLDFQAYPGRYPTASREPRILFDRVTDVLTLAADRNVDGLPEDPDLQQRLRDAARFFVRAAMLRHGLDHFALLGLHRGFEPALLRDHYRMLIRMTHPDFASDQNEWPADAATRINLANDVLASPERRQAYEQSLPLKPAFAEAVVPARRRQAMQPSGAWPVKAAPRRWPFLVAGLFVGLLAVLAFWPAETNHERLTQLVREAPPERPPEKVARAVAAAPAPASAAVAVAAVVPPSTPVVVPVALAQVIGDPPVAAVVEPRAPTSSAASAALPVVVAAVAPSPPPVVVAAVAPSPPPVVASRAELKVTPPVVNSPLAPVPPAAPPAAVAQPKLARATAPGAPTSPAVATTPAAEASGMRMSRVLAFVPPITGAAAATRAPAETPAESRADAALAITPPAAPAATTVATVRPPPRPVVETPASSLVVSPAVAIAAPVSTPAATPVTVPVTISAAIPPARNRVEATESATAPGIRMSDVQPLLTQLLGALQSGRGDQAARLVDRSARPDDSRFTDAFSRMLSGSRVIRLGQVQFAGRAGGEQLVVDGVIQLQLQDNSQQLFMKEFVLRAQFASRAGQTVMTQLVAGEGTR